MKRIASSVAVLAILVIALGVVVATTAPPASSDAGPHCCGTGAAAACRDTCKQLSPGCKGQIGCRAGECVCTCSCTGDPI